MSTDHETEYLLDEFSCPGEEFKSEFYKPDESLFMDKEYQSEYFKINMEKGSKSGSSQLTLGMPGYVPPTSQEVEMTSENTIHDKSQLLMIILLEMQKC